MKTAVSQMIKELQEQFPKEMGDMYERNQLLLEDIALRAKEMEKHQRQEDTNYGYSQGWDDGNQNKEPMRPELKQQEP
jgi:hypothetical protein